MSENSEVIITDQIADYFEPKLVTTLGDFGSAIDPMQEFNSETYLISSVNPISTNFRLIPGLKDVANLPEAELFKIRSGAEGSPLAERVCSSVAETRAHEQGYKVAPNGELVNADVAELYGELPHRDMPSRSAQDPAEFTTTSYDQPGVS
ncbi:hypothetical protein R6242_18750 [Iodobacter sp. CM08]|uniref:hypothetical protein n=1 Tax=Iodobacter sp. CM08 TaxID=3085902 RepID=UPI0029811E36|nr:hypothetical protein [Iodobacter sp. CM08]MDW5418608.1 hypothetical protein [Iodobacter sp. CM08]